ncbi:MAG: lysoplasmalogenase family protein [Myxococcota bacterium]
MGEGLLLGAFVGAYALAYGRGSWDEARTRRSHRELLRGTSAVLVLTALWGAVKLWGGPLQLYGLFTLAGMAITFLGDLVTGGLISSRKPYVVAALVFGLGHFGYLASLWVVRAHFGVDASPVPLGLAALFGLCVWAFLARGGKISLGLAALGYSAVLGSLLGGALVLGFARDDMHLLALGVVFFSISDTLLGYREMQKARWFLMYDMIWAFYIGGQACIVWNMVRVGGS